MIRHRSLSMLFAIAALAMVAQAGEASAAPAPGMQSTDRIIVKLRAAYRTAALRNQPVPLMAADRASALSVTAGVALRAVRPMSDDAHVLALPQAMRNDAVQSVVDRLRSDPAVEYAYVDARERLMAVPNDPLFPQQVHLQVAGVAPLAASVNAPGAWDITTGTSAAVIAIVDGGVRFDHPDLSGRVLAGYDFVGPCNVGQNGCTVANQFTTANDGDGRDADASDPGDWVTATDVASNPVLAGCTVESSSWHGTHIAGIIGAAGNNSLGVTGLNWSATMLPVRVAGRCGGYTSDVVDGMRWAAGLAVPNVPANPHPAKIVNVSLGSAGSCASSAYNQAVVDILATGAIIVAAAGNEDSGVIHPANCTGVISVGAVRGDGMRTIYSNSGANLTIMALGGDFTTATNDRIASTNNSGRTTPDPYSSAGYYAAGAGTSFSTPIVSGVISLMLSTNPNLTASQVTDVLRTTARAFTTVAGFGTCVPGGSGNVNNNTPCNCTTAACGAGYVDANAAVTRAYVLGGGVIAPPVTTPPPATGGGSSGGGGGGGGGSLDLTALGILAIVGLATRGLRRPQRDGGGPRSRDH